MYSNCEGAENWEDFKPVFKQFAEQKGCNGAAQAMPAVAIVAIAVNTRALSCSVTGGSLCARRQCSTSWREGMGGGRRSASGVSAWC